VHLGAKRRYINTLPFLSFLPNPNALVAFSALTLLVGWQEGHPAWVVPEKGRKMVVVVVV